MSRILIAEDEPALLESFCEVVTALGHECVGARDGNEAIDLARKHAPDVLVTDYMMPGKTGVDVIRAIKSDPVLSHVPAILISAARPADKDRGEAWMYLSKPVTLERLERAIEEALKVGAERRARKDFVVGMPDNVSPLSLVREDMLNWVAHEIKSPLAAALTATQLADRSVRQGETGEGVQKRLVTIARQLQRMDELVNAVLDAARLQDGMLTLETESVAVDGLIAETTQFWKDMHSDYTFEVHDGHGAYVNADRERIRQVIDNLISNAIKYGRPSTTIRIDVATTDTHVEISVTDFGQGISPEALPHIFSRFHRVPGQGGRGHGLGLYVASALTRLHGGTIQVKSEVGKGSTFTLVLSRAAGPAAVATSDAG